MKRKRHHDFWGPWRHEQRRFWHEQHRPPWAAGETPPPEVTDAWREYFRQFMGNLPERHWVFGGRRFVPWHQGVDTFNPFLASLLSKGGGLLPLLVLNLLAKKPRYGNEIMGLITESTNGQWIANPGAVYPLMMNLERLGLVQGEWEDPQKRTTRIYSLTEGGQQELERLKSIVRPKLNEAIEALKKMADDLNGDDELGRDVI